MMSFVWLFVSIAQGEVHVWRNNIAKQKIAIDYSSFRSFWICKTHIKVYQAHFFGWSLFRGHGMPQEDTLRICTIQYQRIVFADQGEESHRDPCWARTLKDTKDTSDYLGCQDLPSPATTWHPLSMHLAALINIIKCSKCLKLKRYKSNLTNLDKSWQLGSFDSRMELVNHLKSIDRKSVV